MNLKAIASLAIVATVAGGCSALTKTTYPIQVIDNTDDLLVIRATEKTEYEALNAAKERVVSMIGEYVEDQEPTCAFAQGRGYQNIAGTGVYDYQGSYWECVVYAKKPE